jgi:hypothetical protein
LPLLLFMELLVFRISRKANSEEEVILKSRQSSSSGRAEQVDVSGADGELSHPGWTPISINYEYHSQNRAGAKCGKCMRGERAEKSDDNVSAGRAVIIGSSSFLTREPRKASRGSSNLIKGAALTSMHDGCMLGINPPYYVVGRALYCMTTHGRIFPTPHNAVTGSPRQWHFCLNHSFGRASSTSILCHRAQACASAPCQVLWERFLDRVCLPCWRG